MNRKNNSQKSKKHVSSIESKKKHIEDSDSSEEDDDHVSNIVSFQVTSKKDVTDSVIINVATSKIVIGKSQVHKTFKKPIR